MPDRADTGLRPVAGAVTMLALAMLGLASRRGDWRVGFLAALIFCLAPGFQAISLLMTIDAPFIACWGLSAWAGWHVFRRLEKGDGVTGPAVALGLALGVGFLFKYTILLLVPGFLLFAVLRRRHLHLGGRRWGGLAIGTAVFAVFTAPVWV